MIVSVAGHVEWEAIKDRVEELFGDWPSIEVSPVQSGPASARNDHVPFQRVGIPAALLCDFDFGGVDPVRRQCRNRYRHTGEDRLERISKASLQIAGDVLLETVNKLLEGD